MLFRFKMYKKNYDAKHVPSIELGLLHDDWTDFLLRVLLRNANFCLILKPNSEVWFGPSELTPPWVDNPTPKLDLLNKVFVDL